MMRGADEFFFLLFFINYSTVPGQTDPCFFHLSMTAIDLFVD